MSSSSTSGTVPKGRPAHPSGPRAAARPDREGRGGRSAGRQAGVVGDATAGGRAMTLPMMSAADLSACSRKWAYTFKVVAALRCPSRPATVRMSTPAPNSWVATKWRKSWRRTPATPSAAHSRRKARDTESGYHGFDASSAVLNTKASSATATSHSSRSPPHPVTMFGQQLGGLAVERHPPHCVCLRVLLDQPIGSDDDASFDGHDTIVEVHVAPSQGDQLRSTSAGRCRHDEEAGELRSRRGRTLQNPNQVRRRGRLNLRAGHSRRRRHGSRG